MSCCAKHQRRYEEIMKKKITLVIYNLTVEEATAVTDFIAERRRKK